ncbi:MAG: hypothetical protein Q4D78_09730 [Neisseria zoodegmatis]|uniref:hypothetical protein n=1 Tax=Neisseria zoodegmatis TaxID=326523 RepID=UPI0026F06218|nr:hypothetical protein [Neisseria zoodegmatis]MDO5070448.1 hypothetical protein [Neisseria zoodegmatis]
MAPHLGMPPFQTASWWGWPLPCGMPASCASASGLRILFGIDWGRLKAGFQTALSDGNYR